MNTHNKIQKKLSNDKKKIFKTYKTRVKNNSPKY